MAETSKLIYAGLFCLFFAFSAKDFFQSGDQASQSKEIPTTKFGHSFVGPTLKVLYCYSWGYRRVFEQYASILQEKYPDITVYGDTYPPPFLRMYLAQFISIFKFVLIALIWGGIDPFVSLGTTTPQFYTWMTQNKLYACLMTFFLSNTIESQLVSTGAFEIAFNDVPVWSKLETGRIPSPPELFQIIDNHILLRSDSPQMSL